MIRSAIRSVVWLTAAGVIAYLFFFVPLGRRTVWEHVRRIAATDEARDLGEDVQVATDRAGEALRGKLREGAVDAGP